MTTVATMTTEAMRTRFVAWAVLAPTTACGLGLAADWAVNHDPHNDAASETAGDEGRGDQRLAELRSQVRQARGDFVSTRQRVLRVERTVLQRSRQMGALTQQSARTTRAQRADVQSVPLPAGPAPTAAAPTPPPTDTTTGSS
jgi:hypothetical protein